jgi:hypothetical protein
LPWFETENWKLETRNSKLEISKLEIEVFSWCLGVLVVVICPPAGWRSAARAVSGMAKSFPSALDVDNVCDDQSGT